MNVLFWQHAFAKEVPFVKFSLVYFGSLLLDQLVELLALLVIEELDVFRVLD